MNIKKRRKKIRLLEARLEKGAKRLAKLKRKLGAATAVGGGKAKKKSASTRGQKRKGRMKARSAKSAGVKKPARKAKRKLNLTPERRAELAAAMKARWAAKKAAAEPAQQTSHETAPMDQGFTLGQNPLPS